MALRGCLSVALLALGLAACASQAPVSLSLSNGQAIEGALARNAAYTSLRSGDQAAGCRASYTGRSTSSVVLLELRCGDGRYGIGTGELANARVAGKVRMQDGEEVSIEGEAR